MNPKLVLIPPQEVTTLLAQNAAVAQYFAEALMTDPTRYDANRTIELIEAGEMQMWCILDMPMVNHDGEKDLLAVFLTTIRECGGTRWLRVPFLAGRDMSDWIHLMETLKELASDQGCTELEVVGRSGWARVLKPYGFEEKCRTFIVRDLQEPKLEVAHG